MLSASELRVRQAGEPRPAGALPSAALNLQRGAGLLNAQRDRFMKGTYDWHFRTATYCKVPIDY